MKRERFIVGLERYFHEKPLEGMADAGGGSYRFVGNPEELPTVIAAELERTTRTFARQARVRIHLADGVPPHDVYGWETTAHLAGVEELLRGEGRQRGRP